MQHVLEQTLHILREDVIRAVILAGVHGTVVGHDDPRSDRAIHGLQVRLHPIHHRAFARDVVFRAHLHNVQVAKVEAVPEDSVAAPSTHVGVLRRLEAVVGGDRTLPVRIVVLVSPPGVVRFGLRRVVRVI